MQAETVQHLIALNQKFYQSLAESFSATRGRLQPGVLSILEGIPGEESVLDLGCGNGELAAELARRGHTGEYVGVDFSEGLLEEARKRAKGLKARFVQAELASGEWRLESGDFDWVLAFAVLHHIPGEEKRLGLLAKVRGWLAERGRFAHSNWQFLNSARLWKRIQPWAAAGLSDGDVDAGDYLLDWRRDGAGLRYVHVYSAGELSELAGESGFDVLDMFSSDGEGGDLGLYGIWGKGNG
ncbi:MAG: class I SAM-dependent methyltransferase [Chloroflexi bacterium]|nr:class I SAM-dependent methyltransferase [Chloroflexota bacterium]MQC26356.1 class I SAM-dependent methyltransferase [Chloroflexota bacterium]